MHVMCSVYACILFKYYLMSIALLVLRGHYVPLKQLKENIPRVLLWYDVLLNLFLERACLFMCLYCVVTIRMTEASCWIPCTILHSLSHSSILQAIIQKCSLLLLSFWMILPHYHHRAIDALFYRVFIHLWDSRLHGHSQQILKRLF